jgi:hypothetical protein
MKFDPCIYSFPVRFFMKRIRIGDLERCGLGDDLRGEESINLHPCSRVWRKVLIPVILRLPHLSQRLMALGTALKQHEAAQLVAMTTHAALNHRSPIVKFITFQFAFIRFRFVFL